MRFHNICWIVFLLGFTIVVNGQERDANTGYFLVEEEKFNPPDSAIISHYLGKKAMAFMAKDMNQKEQYLGDYTGKLLLLWFWNTENQVCLEAIEKLNQLTEELPDQFSLISLADEDRASLDEFLKINPVNFSIIPNADILSKGAYVQELGCPRLFFIDAHGIIQKILPASFFTHHPSAFEDVRAMILAHVN